jgi:hypothetical protein
MGAISFLNPGFLGAMVLAGLPILIHLIRKRKVRVVRWAAFEFLRQAQKKQKRRLRIEQLLLLIVRILLVACVVLAFARPVLQSAFGLLAGGSHVQVIIALDNSASMGFRRSGATDFENARKAAEELLTRVVRAGDSVRILTISSRPASLLKSPTFDLSTARERLRTAKLSDFGTDYAASAQFLLDQLTGDKTPVKELYWITDTQKSGFPETVSDRTKNTWRKLGETVRITWVDVGGARENLWLEPPTLSREMITPQAPVRINAIVHNDTARARDALLINLLVEGKVVGSTRVKVEARGRATAEFVHLFDKPGVQVGAFQITESDGLVKDSQSYFVARVRERLKVLVVNGAPSEDPQKDEAFYLTTALSPLSLSRGGTSSILPTEVANTRLSTIDLRPYDAVILAGYRGGMPGDREALEDYVRNGGGLLIFPGMEADANRINTSLGGEDPLLPALLGKWQARAETTAPGINPASIQHPALSIFRNAADVDISTARFTGLFPLVVRPTDDAARVMAQLSTGEPALVERRVGQGRVILAAFGGNVRGSNLPFKPTYVPLVHQLTAYLSAGGSTTRQVRVGDALTARFDVKAGGRPVRVERPDGTAEIIKSALSGDGVVARYPTAEQAGAYRMLVEKTASEAFAANLTAGESDLTPATEAQVRDSLARIRLQFTHQGEDLAALVQRNRRGSEIWRGLIWTVLGLLALEALLAQRFGRRG